ncbi:hypothetical protein BdWA1_000289 [Babesia duncani]|uniref:Uncharacterized protein n=1 Tax=Babesia duncani TaxID=323732 RepID=A0AAD9UPY7_9APIC|nr:hypothetical protein BdWA1_000289 [Babesia duncani]
MTLELDADVGDSIECLKSRITAAISIPEELQSLLVLEGPIKDELPRSAVEVENYQLLSDFSHRFLMNPHTKELTIHLLLGLPAPHYVANEAKRSKIGEYIAALDRYALLIDKCLAENDTCKVEPGSHINNITSFQEQAKKAHPGGFSDAEKKEKQAEKSEHFVLPNKRFHLLLYHDYPKAGNLKQELMYCIQSHFPIDLDLQLKFSVACSVILQTTQQPRWVQVVLKWAPLALLTLQTRLGKRIYKTILYATPTEYIPSGRFFMFINQFQSLQMYCLHQLLKHWLRVETCGISSVSGWRACPFHLEI